MKSLEPEAKKETAKSMSAVDFFSSAFNTGSTTTNSSPLQPSSQQAVQPKPAITPAQKSQSDLMSIIDIPPFLQK